MPSREPLINFRQDDLRQELSLSLYGEVQNEVTGATLAGEFGVAVTFSETTTIHVERLDGAGAAVDVVKQNDNPFSVRSVCGSNRCPPRSGVEFRYEVELGSLPLAFMKAIEEAARRGRLGDQV